MQYFFTILQKGPWDLISSALHEHGVCGASPDLKRESLEVGSPAEGCYLVRILVKYKLPDPNMLAKAAQKLAPFEFPRESHLNRRGTGTLKENGENVFAGLR